VTWQDKTRAGQRRSCLALVVFCVVDFFYWVATHRWYLTHTNHRKPHPGEQHPTLRYTSLNEAVSSTQRPARSRTYRLAVPSLRAGSGDPLNEKLRKTKSVFKRLARVCLPLLLTLCFLDGIPMRSQQNPGITVDVKVVSVLATVRNKHGDIVRNLTKDDFVLEEDGHPQTIAYFTQETNQPLTLGLLVDTSLSQRSVLGEERSASYSFLDHVIREDRDKAFVIHFDREVELLQDLTASRKKLESALALLEEPERGSGNSGGGRGQRGSRGGAGTLLYDAVYLASNELMGKQQGRKSLIILSDGVDHGSKETLETAITSAQRADTIVYSILFAGDEGGRPNGGFGGPGWGGMGPMGGGGGHRRYPQEQHPDGKKVLDQVSKETGGHLFEVSKKLTVDQIYAAIEDELRNQYSLGYSPDKTDESLPYHKIHLTTKQKDLTVQARDGYYSNR
jgi:VWFA-related protein